MAAFFDMDRTVVLANTGRLYARDLRRRGEIGLAASLRVGVVLLRYKLSLVDMNRVMNEAALSVKGWPEADMVSRCAEIFDRDVRPAISSAAVEAIESHRRSGHRIALLTASTQYMTRQLSECLGISDYLCTRLEVSEGHFTGACQQPLCFGEGKVTWAKRYADQHGIDLAASYFYTDSYSDLPMLEAVGHRRVVNPDPRLRLHAYRAKWPVLLFRR